MSGEFESARAQLVIYFNKVRALRPEGTRQQSPELFLVGLGRRQTGFMEGGPKGKGA